MHAVRSTCARASRRASSTELAEAFICDHGGEPAFRGYRGFPASICPSVNEGGRARDPGLRTVLREGDIVGLDVGVRKDGYYGDAAVTLPVGEVSAEAAKLLRVTREALELGIARAVAGNRVGDISHAIQEHAEHSGYSVVKRARRPRHRPRDARGAAGSELRSTGRAVRGSWPAR